MTDECIQLRRMIDNAKRVVFFGGAGVSTESGIPDFRGAHGLYAAANGQSYEDMLSSRFFETRPDEFWAFYKSVMLYPNARPNPAHYALARLEARGVLSAVITQNIDGLHQLAGSQNVLELHGSVLGNTCTRCSRRYTLDFALKCRGTPRCSCTAHGVLHPDIVLYGEPLDPDVLTQAIEAVERCDLLIVGGTSLVVHPAAGLVTRRRPGVPLALINRDPTPYDGRAQLILRENIATVLAQAIPADEGDEAPCIT